MTDGATIADYKKAYRIARARGTHLLHKHEGYTDEVYAAFGEAEEIYSLAIERFGKEAWRNAE